MNTLFVLEIGSKICCNMNKVLGNRSDIYDEVTFLKIYSIRKIYESWIIFLRSMDENENADVGLKML